MKRVDGRHRRIVGQTHQVLAQRVQAVIDVFGGNDSGITPMQVAVGFAQVFLWWN